MTQEQIDNLIADWRRKIAVATENLLALDDTLAMKRIDGRDGFSVQPLAGVTAARVLPALVAMRDLFGQIGTISEVVERASRTRRTINRLWRYSETLAEIEHLLTGASIPLPELKTPLAERNLLSSAANTRAITPERLLMAMTDAFATARDAVLSVEAAWERWEPIQDALHSKEATLSQQCVTLGLSPPPQLIEARRKIEELGRRVASDPLGITGTADRDMSALLSAARTAVETDRREREAVGGDLLAARRFLTEIAEQEAAVICSHAACQEVLDSSALPQPGVGTARLRQLEEWLVSLEGSAHEKRWQAVSVGLHRWLETAKTTQAALADAQKANQSLLDLPSELQGRHAVLLARMRMTGSTDVTLERLLLQARTLLDEPRLPAERTTKLIEACEERLRRETTGRIQKK
ncbi:MAG: hypothetical protein H8F28_15140 [Fibrella sp.]|nr:hypothetical protein [Armatimonadota bacterium]